MGRRARVIGGREVVGYSDDVRQAGSEPSPPSTVPKLLSGGEGLEIVGCSEHSQPAVFVRTCTERRAGDEVTVSKGEVSAGERGDGEGEDKEKGERGGERGDQTGDGFRVGYWPEAIGVAVAAVGAEGVVQPPLVGVTRKWEVREPVGSSPHWIDGEALERWLGPEYPDQGLFAMLAEGCATGYEGKVEASSQSNYPSVRGHVEEISAKISLEASVGRLVDVTWDVSVVTPLAMVPKPGSLKHRMIRDLSVPVGSSINEGITGLPDLTLPQLGDVLRLVLAWRAAGFRRIYLRRVDVDGAYRRVPVRARDRWQLVLEWLGVLRADAVLPMGLKSSCHLYQRITLALIWGLARRGISAAGYLDDSILVGPADRVEGWAVKVREVLDQVGMKHSKKKWIEDGEAAEKGTVLGYAVDLEKDTVSVPEAKLKRLETALRRMVRATAMRRAELAQITGWVGHLVRVVPAMKTWCGGLYHQSGAFAKRTDSRWTRVSQGAKRCGRAWLRWLRARSGGVMFAMWGCRMKTWTVYSDASEWGGAFWTRELGGVWWRWEDVWPGFKPKMVHINVLELVALVTAVWWWRKEMRGRVVRLRADNTVALGVLRRGHSGASPHLQAVVERWGEVLGWAQGGAVISWGWVASHANLFADALSRNPFGTSQVDREAAAWRGLFEGAMQVKQLRGAREDKSWWASWMKRLAFV